MTRATNKGLHFLLFLLTCFLALPLSNADTTVYTHPLPIAELEKVVTVWLGHHGFRMTRATLDMGQKQLLAQKENQVGLILLKPRSPLATEIQGKWTLQGKPDMSPQKALNDYIEAYLNGENPECADDREGSGQVIPAAVLTKLESVVCLKAKLEKNDIQFSGFIIDKEGLILSTAHDMKGLRQITVVLHDGRQFQGNLIRIDPRRDLAFIDIDTVLATSISLTQGRNLLGIGEWLYSVGCPINLRGTVYPGVVNGPPRKADDLPLWQVNMEIHPGSSGSPVFDVEGNLVAVVKGRYRGTDTVGFLIPFETIIEFAKDM
jgi:serine protease Do